MVARRTRRPAAGQRGFTLIELIVSLSAGVMVSVAMFMLARNASKMFEHEARISTATMGATFGMSRIVSDIRRAGFMSSPNVLVDPRICGDKSKYPDGLAGLASITIEDGGSPTDDNELNADNGLEPDAIIIGGSFDTTEQFAVNAVVGSEIYLNPSSGAMVRTAAAAQTGGLGLAELFRVGRIVRIIDQEGRHIYGVIQDIDPDPAAPVITLSDDKPPIPFKDDGSPCGCAGNCSGTVINPVARVRYDLRVVDLDRYAGLYATATHSLAARHRGRALPARTELVRVELDFDDNEVDETLEVVAEYAVDLEFGVTEVELGTTELTRHNIDAADAYENTGAPASGSMPQRVRSLAVRLSTRGSIRDRETLLAPPPGGGVFRYSLGDNLGFVRARTMTTEVELQNVTLTEVNW